MGDKKEFCFRHECYSPRLQMYSEFRRNDIYIPIVVLEELDHFKKGNEQINFNAREFARELDLIANESLFKKGIGLGKGKGKLFILTGGDYPDIIAKSFIEKTSDHRILASTYTCGNKKAYKTILVTKDINLRMKALSIGIEAEDYINDKVTNINIFEKINEVYTHIQPEIIDKLYSSEGSILVDELDFASDIEPQDCFILKSVRSSVLVRYNQDKGIVKRIEKNVVLVLNPEMPNKPLQ